MKILTNIGIFCYIENASEQFLTFSKLAKQFLNPIHDEKTRSHSGS